MKFEFIRDNRPSFRVEKMCQVFGVTRSGYYAWRKRGKSQRQQENEQLTKTITDIFHGNHQRYGYPRVWFELRLRGVLVSKGRVARLMRSAGLRSRRVKKFKQTTNSKHSLPIAPNRLNKNFKVSEPDRVWVSDITYLWTWEGWLYLAVIIDLYSRQVVGWALSTRINKELVLAALNQAINRRNPINELIFHSDRGSQYASYQVCELLEKYKFIQSMSNKGDCYDNAVAESFFATLKLELVYPDFFRSRYEARLEIFEFIEIYYNRKRRHSFLNYQSPAAFETVKNVA
jgi:putative transposase